MLRHPLTIDYADELVNIEMSRRLRLILVLIDAGEIDEEQADKLRRLPEPELEKAA